MKKIYLISTVTIFLAIPLYVIFIAAYGLFCKGHTSEVCVVLGNKVNRDGTPSPRLKARLDKALSLYQSGFCKSIIVSGGTGKEGYNEPVVMKRYLVSSGVSDSLVVVDSTGYNTYGTACFVIKYCTENGISSVVAVSQYFHLLRVRVTLGRIGIENVSVAAPRFFEIRDIYSILREAVGLPVYLFKTR